VSSRGHLNYHNTPYVPFAGKREAKVIRSKSKTPKMTGKKGEKLGKVLDIVLDTQLKRKAKAIIMTCIQFIFVENLIMFQTTDKIEETGKGMAIYDKFSYAGAGYAGLLAVFLFFHALFLPKNINVREEVGLAYAKTNNIPILDSLLEIPLAAQFKGTLWWLVWVAWGMCGAVVAGWLILYYMLPNEELKGTMYMALSVAILQIYQITGDFSEYWIFTRNIASSDEEHARLSMA